MSQILQRVQNGEFTFSAFDYRSEIFSVVRSSYGLSESEFLEFVSQGYFERPDLYLASFEGEIPEPTQAMSAKALRAQQVQRAARQAKK